MFGHKDEKIKILLDNRSLNLTFDVVVADGRFGEKKQKMLEKEFADAGLDIKEYLDQLEEIFHKKLKKMGKNLILFDVFWNAYKYRKTNNIVIYNVTQLEDGDNINRVYPEKFEDLLTAIISDFRILDDEMDVLIQECAEERIHFDEALFALKERLAKVKLEEVDTFLQFWEAKKLDPKRMKKIMKLEKYLDRLQKKLK